MLWQHYVFRRGREVEDLWEGLYKNRPISVLYISGRGFDLRAQKTLKSFVRCLSSLSAQVMQAKLLLIGLPAYRLSSELSFETEENAKILEAEFSAIGITETISPKVADDD